MKIQNILALLLVLTNCSDLVSQEDEKSYYKDTLFNFYGSKIEITKSLATKNSFKSVVTIANQTDKFLIINPWEVFGGVSNSSDKYNAVSKKAVVVPPKYTKKFTLKFEGKDFRKQPLSYDITKIQITDKVENIYEFPDIDIYNENLRKVGPIKWTMVKKMEPDHGKDDFRVMVEIEYSGDKFLGIFYNNITLVTKDGGKFFNAGKKTGNFHYDNSKPLAKQTYVFPVEQEKIKKTNEPKINFSDVFKEYSLSTIVGFKVNLRTGTLEDYKGKSGKPDDKDIDEME